MKSCFQNLILRRKKSNFWIEKKIKKRGWSPVFALLKLCTISVCPKEPLAETRKVEWKESSSREREPAKENSENTLLCSVASSLSLSLLLASKMSTMKFCREWSVSHSHSSYITYMHSHLLTLSMPHAFILPKIKIKKKKKLYISFVVKILIFLCFKKTNFSNNILYPKEDKDQKILLYACRNCDHQVLSLSHFYYYFYF